MFSYTVRCTINKPETAESWLAWLTCAHIQDVLDAGATRAEIFEMETVAVEARTFEIRYRFDSVESFLEYERSHAPRLRAEGLEKFPLEMGLEYTRSTGKSLHKFNC